MTGGPTINDKFPNLQGATQLQDDFDVYEYLGDFTPVCNTKLGQAALHKEKFTKCGTKLCGFSCNDSNSHKNLIKGIEVVTGGKVKFPLFCDPMYDAAVELSILDETNKDTKGLPLT
eukprot:11422111-Ditylum_brightwellii.AAC.1